MTEAEWFSCPVPELLLAFLANADCNRPQARLFRLYACGVCRTDPAWPAFRGRLGAAALATCERHADADADAGELPDYRARRSHICELMVACAATPDWVAAALGTVDVAVAKAADRPAAVGRCVDLVHEIFGNPFAPLTLPAGPPVRCPTCRGWDGYNERCEACRGTSAVPGPCPFATPRVRAMAAAIYDDMAWGDLPILADALEDAGCPEEEGCPVCGSAGHLVAGQDVATGRKLYAGCPTCASAGLVPHALLAHLRGPGPHVRGCHVLDLLVGRRRGGVGP